MTAMRVLLLAWRTAPPGWILGNGDGVIAEVTTSAPATAPQPAAATAACGFGRCRGVAGVGDVVDS